MKDDRLYLIHISESIGRVEAYTVEGRDAFMRDTKTQDAVIRNLQTLAESMQRLSDGFRRQHPEHNWRNIAAFRNAVVHDYLGVDLEEIWRVVEHDPPTLKHTIIRLLQEPGSKDEA